MSRQLQCDQCGAVVSASAVGWIRHRYLTRNGEPPDSPDEYEIVCPECCAQDSLDDYEEPPMQIRDMTVGEFLDALEAEWGGPEYTHATIAWTCCASGTRIVEATWFRSPGGSMTAPLQSWDAFVSAVNAYRAAAAEAVTTKDREDAARLQAAGWAVSPPELQPAVLQETGR